MHANAVKRKPRNELYETKKTNEVWILKNLSLSSTQKIERLFWQHEWLPSQKNPQEKQRKVGKLIPVTGYPLQKISFRKVCIKILKSCINCRYFHDDSKVLLVRKQSTFHQGSKKMLFYWLINWKVWYSPISNEMPQLSFISLYAYAKVRFSLHRSHPLSTLFYFNICFMVKIQPFSTIFPFRVYLHVFILF